MTAVLLPRLSRLGVDEVLRELRRSSNVSKALKKLDPNRSGLSFAASGGSRVDEKFLMGLRSHVVMLAKQEGYPQQVDISGRARFDVACSIFLADVDEFTSGEALRDDVWAFMACVLLPDVTVWRFSTRTTERFYGGDRNMFQRLWYRSTTMDRGKDHLNRWELIQILTEDAFAQIVERPSIRGDKRLALAIAEGWLRMNIEIGGSSMERVMRRTIRAIRIRNEIQLLSILQDSDLEDFVDEQFRESWIQESSPVFLERANTNNLGKPETEAVIL